MSEYEPPIIASRPYHERYIGLAVCSKPIGTGRIIILAAHQDNYPSIAQRFNETELLPDEWRTKIQPQTGTPISESGYQDWLRDMQGIEDAEDYFFLAMVMEAERVEPILDAARGLKMLAVLSDRGSLEEQVVADRRERFHARGLTPQLYKLALSLVHSRNSSQQS